MVRNTTLQLPLGMDTFNSRQIHAAEIPGAAGISEARALARMYGACVAEVDGIRLINDDTVRKVRSEYSRGPGQDTGGGVCMGNGIHEAP
ncbi:MAG: hypothetical protein CM1200mP26_18750 [Acidimicrobiales bacterium]|nr:MAG: hypothetical protein CM1200mP26_18750 [Acidimicrobiales bacterium]